MLENCKTYNEPSSWLFRDACKLQKSFDNEVLTLSKKEEIEEIPSKETESKPLKKEVPWYLDVPSEKLDTQSTELEEMKQQGESLLTSFSF